MEYKVGDKVIISEGLREHPERNSQGEMDHWIGEVMTVRKTETNPFHNCTIYRTEEDIDERSGRGWVWFEDMIEGLAGDLIEVNKDDLLNFLG